MQTIDVDMDDELRHELSRTLVGEGRPDAWRVDEVLKESPAEVTQLVWLRTADGGELGPYVRKVIATHSGLGQVWQRLWRCQQRGLRSHQLPRVVLCEERDGMLYVVMERVIGPTLRELVLATPPDRRLDLAQRVIPNLCSAVTELNESLGEVVIHRDITPSNVICSGLKGEVPVLVDLGIARVWEAGQEADTTHFGTRSYAPPEQFGFGQTDLRTDVYAIGMCMFFCLTGRDPLPSDREADFATEEVPEQWRAVIAKACSFDPDERYGSARELKGAIDALVGGSEEGVTPRRPTVKDVLVRIWRARNIVVLPVVALLVIVSTSCVFDPATLNRGDPRFNAFGYLVYLNYCFLALGYVLMDKRWLRKHVRIIREWPPGRIYGMLAIVFAILTALLVVLAGILL